MTSFQSYLQSSLLEIKDKFCFHFSISTWIIFSSKETKSAIHFGLPIGCLFLFSICSFFFCFNDRWRLKVLIKNSGGSNLISLKSKTSFASIFPFWLGIWQPHFLYRLNFEIEKYWPNHGIIITFTGAQVIDLTVWSIFFWRSNRKIFRSNWRFFFVFYQSDQSRRRRPSDPFRSSANQSVFSIFLQSPNEIR